MRFFEYEAREIVRRAGIPVTDYGFTRDPVEAGGIAARIGGPVVVKSQVLTGGRMKAGGIQFADTPAEAERARARTSWGWRSAGTCRAACWSTRGASVVQEYYAGVVWDGIRKRPVMLFSDMGGIDIEEVAEDASRPRRARAFLDDPAAVGLPREGGDRVGRRDRLAAEPARPDPHAAGASCSSSAT